MKPVGGRGQAGLGNQLADCSRLGTSPLFKSSHFDRQRTQSATLLPVIVPLRVVPTQAIATHAPVNVAALDVITAEAGDGGGIDVMPAAPGPKWKSLMKSSSERQRQVDRDGVKVRPSVLALEPEQSCVV
jgi:hypothetical protein